MNTYLAQQVKPFTTFSSRQFSYCFSVLDQRIFLEFTQAVFKDDLDGIKLPANDLNVHKFGFIFNLKEGKQANIDQQLLENSDLLTISTTLQFLYNVSHRLQTHVIESQLYIKILQRYYEKIGLNSQSELLNRVIKSNINITYLLPIFMFTENAQVLSMLKLKQLQLFELFCKSRRITIQEFMRIIQPAIYNITDMPLIFRLFYQYFYPSFEDIETIAELEMVLDYLSKFDCINPFIIEKSLVFLNDHLQDQCPTGRFTIQSYFSVINCLSIIQFKASRALMEMERTNSKNKFSKLTKHILQQTIEVQGQSFLAKNLSKQEKITQIITHLSKIIQLNFNQFQEEHTKIHDSSVRPLLVQGIYEKYRLFHQQNNSKTIIKLAELEIIPKIIRYLHLSAQYFRITAQDFINFLESNLFKDFLDSYPCYPDLYKELILSIENLQQNFFLKNTPSITSVFSRKMNYFLNHTLKTENEQQIIEQYYSPKFAFRRDHQGLPLWILKGQNLIHRMISINQDYTCSNILGLMQGENSFLLSRLKYCLKQLIQQSIKQHKGIPNKQLDSWKYPYYFYFTVRGKQHTIKGLQNNFLNRNALIPKILQQNQQLYMRKNEKLMVVRTLRYLLNRM